MSNSAVSRGSRAVALVVVLLAVSLPGSAAAHRSGCHGAHSCPSDHHTYVWHDANGKGWDCAEAGASEVSAADTTPIRYDNRAYLCRQAGGASPSPETQPATGSSAPATRTSGCAAHGPLPDRRCTPGTVLPGVTAAEVCTAGWATRHRSVSESVKERVYASYGIAGAHHGRAYEVDHLISLELGGSNDTANLWPEAAGAQIGFREKDALENYLHREVCAGTIALGVAQHRIALDWLAAFRAMQRRR